MMKPRTIYQPRWMFSDTIAVDVDARNWIIYHRHFNPDKGYTKWRARAYYATAKQLFAANDGIFNWMTRNDIHPDDDVVEHIKRCADETRKVADAFLADMGVAEGISRETFVKATG